MTAAIRTELLKLRTTRLWLGLLGAAACLTAFVAVVESARSGNGSAIPSLATTAGQRDILTTTGFAMIVAGAFGTTVATGEFRHRTATDTYLDQPHRVLVLAAKAAVGAVGGVVFGVVAALITTGVALGYVAADDYTRLIPAGDIVRYGLGAAAGAALLAAVGVGLGSLLRSQLGAIIAVFAWGFGVEQLLGGLFDAIAPYLPITAANTMAGATGSATMPPVPSGTDPLPSAAAAGVLVAVTVVLSVIAARTTVRRDIT